MPNTDIDEAKLNENVQDLAADLAGYIPDVLSYEYEASQGDPWGDARGGEKYYSTQVYGSSYGPSAGEILWDDVAPEDAERPDWADELCDDLADKVTSLLQARFPDRACVAAFWEDNCLMVVISEE